MEQELKSVRIRPREVPVGYKEDSLKSGGLDLKISVIQTGKKERTVAAYKLTEDGESRMGAWVALPYKGRRYEDLSDDDLIEDYVRSNTLRERPVEGEFVTVEGIKLPYYNIVQDPFDKKPPVNREYGYDPYYLTNGAQVFVNWYASKKEKVQWIYNDLTTSTQSLIGEVSLQIVTNQPDRPPLSYTYSASNNPIQPGVTPSFQNIYFYWLSQEQSIIQITSNNLVYLPPGKEFIDENSLTRVGGMKYGSKNPQTTLSQGFGNIDGYLDDARDSATPSLSIKPKGLAKRIEVVPPEGNETWVLTDSTNDWMGSDFFPIYKKDLTDSIGEKYFLDKSAEGDFSQGQDWMLISDLLGAWNKKVGLYNVELCNPSYIPKKTIEYKDPINPPTTQPEEITATSSGTQSAKIKLNILFPTEFEVQVRQDCPDFRIFIGDIPTELLPGEGFQFQDSYDPLEELDPEYVETPFAGEEESPSDLPEVSDLENSKVEVSSTQTFEEGKKPITPGQVVKLPETYSHTSAEGFDLLNSQWIGDLIASAKSHIKTPTYDISGTEKGNLGCASAVSIIFYRAFGVHMKTGKEVKSKPQSIDDFGNKGTSALGGWFGAAPTLYKKIPWEQAEPGDIMNTERNFSTNKAGHIGVVIDVKDKDGSWAIVSNSSKGFAGGGGGAIKQNYSVKKWKEVTNRNPSKTFAYRYIGPSLAKKQA